VAQYVLSLSGAPHDSLRAQLGKPKFGACAACHGANGKGNPALGAPNLTDDVWLHGWGEQAIINIINNGKINVMPAQEGKLTEAQIHVLTAYVWGLSNPAAAAKP
jgi:cytochrome c oxidase cbb3-type subunit 3